MDGEINDLSIANLTKVADLKRTSTYKFFPHPDDIKIALIGRYINELKEKLENFNQLDIRVDKKWNREAFSFSFYFEILNILAQKVPVPSEYGLARDSQGVIINPISLSEVDIDRSTIIPSFGFSVDF